MIKRIDVMRMILKRHKENRKFYQDNKNYLGEKHCDQMVFDWTVAIFTVESFGELK